VKQFTESEFAAYVEGQYEDQAPAVLAQVGRWLERGDGAAVYENHDLGHPDLGMPKIVSYGSSQAMLEVSEPPERLPDIGGSINWRFVLVGTYRKGSLCTISR
jgi:hypothetical protein